MVAVKQSPLARPKPRPRRRRSWGEVAFGAVCGAVLLYLAITPLAMLVFSSLKNSGTSLPFEVPGFSLANFVYVLTDPATYTLFEATMVFALGSLVLGMGLSLGLAYLLERTDIPGRSWLRAMVLSPMAIPPVVLAIAWVLLANPSNGMLTLVMKSLIHAQLDIYSLVGMMWVSGLVSVPSIYLLVAPMLVRLDPALEESGSLCGAGWLSRMRRITVPLLRPALFAAAMFFFVVMIEAFDIPAIIGLPRNIYLFSTLIYEAAHPNNAIPNYGQASGYGMVLVAIALCLVWGYRRVTAVPDRFKTITGRGYRPRRVRLGAARWPATVGIVAYFIIAVAGPLLTLIWASLLPFYSLPSRASLAHVSLANYLNVLHYPGILAAARNTLIIAISAATFTMILSTWAAWVSVRRRFRFSGAPMDLTFLITGAPGVVVGFSILVLYLFMPDLLPPIKLYGTIWIIVIAYVTRFLAYGTRLMDAAMRQLDRELEDAAFANGGSFWAVARRVVVPLLLPAIGRGWLWVSVHSIREVPMAALLYAVGNQTVAVALWLAWTENTDIGFASALAVLLSIVCMILTWLISRRGDLEGETGMV